MRGSRTGSWPHEGAHIDWLPQETILFEGSRLDRQLDVELLDGATLTAVEAVLLGREAMGEAARERPPARQLAHPAQRQADPCRSDGAERRSGRSATSLSLLDGAVAFATVLHVAPDAERRLDAVRALLPESGGASVVGERLTVRLLASSGLALRRSLSPIIALLSSAGSIPRLWTL